MPIGSAPNPGAVRFEPLSGRLFDGREGTRLRPRTAALLDYLACNAGRLVSKDELLREIWRDAIVTEDSLVQCVKEIRQALGDERHELIRTVPRRGYAFVGRVRPEELSTDSTRPESTRSIWLIPPGAGNVERPPLATTAPVVAAPVARARAWHQHRARLAMGLIVAVLAATGIIWRQAQPLPAEVVPVQLSIVVLPFTSVGNEPDNDYFATGLTYDLTTDLSRIPHSTVIAHGTAETYKREPRDLREIGRELGVRYLLSGNVRRVGDQIRLNVMLVDGQDGRQIWADRFDGNRLDLVALHRQVMDGLVRRLQLAMLSADVERGRRQKSSNPDAYDLALRGWALLLRKQPEATAQGREAAQQAVKLDPQSAFAWAVLSRSYFMDIAARWMHLRGHSREEWMQRAEHAASTAYALDPELFETMGAYANVLTLRGKYDEAVALHEKQIARYPSDPEPYHMSAYAYERMGEPAKSIALEAEAMRVSPRDDWTFGFLAVTAAAHLHLGQDEQALAAAERAIELRPRFAVLHALAAAAAANLGHDEMARARIAEFRRLQPDYTISKFRADFSGARPAYYAQREHFYRGLHKAGLPQ
jgi:TolB-like protein/DNA-binding winged helix-turn-helix (wHTH) protein/Flp pilus assembly protein TadD